MDKKVNNTLAVYYCDIPNMGDQLNALIIKKIWGIEIVKSNIYNSKISTIGSGLGAFTTRGHHLCGIEQRIIGPFCKPVYIWGTGFIQKRKDGNEGRFFRKMHFCAVRGNLSRNRVEQILGYEINIPVGDGGILAPALLKDKSETISKKYDVGIIPHWREKKHPLFDKLKSSYSNSVLIDLNEDPLEVVKVILECKMVVSSSLHGLIVADSFHIPNIHVVVTDKMIGDGFKFEDYYSAYNLEHQYIRLDEHDFPSKDWIICHYKVNAKDVENMKKRMLASFPFIYDASKNCVCLK